MRSFERLRKSISQPRLTSAARPISRLPPVRALPHTGHPDYNWLLRNADSALYVPRSGRDCEDAPGEQDPQHIKASRPGAQNRTGNLNPHHSCNVCCVRRCACSLPPGAAPPATFLYPQYNAARRWRMAPAASADTLQRFALSVTQSAVLIMRLHLWRRRQGRDGKHRGT